MPVQQHLNVKRLFVDHNSVSAITLTIPVVPLPEPSPALWLLSKTPLVLVVNSQNVFDFLGSIGFGMKARELTCAPPDRAFSDSCRALL